MVLRQSPLLKRRQYADRADEMLIHRKVVIHVELRHRHDLAEFRNEAAQHACFVHHAQQGFRRVAVDQHVEKKGIGFRVVAKLLVDQEKRLPHCLQGIRMNFGAIGAGH